MLRTGQEIRAISSVLGDSGLKSRDCYQRLLDEALDCLDDGFRWPFDISEKYLGGTLSVILQFYRTAGRNASDLEMVGIPSDKLVPAVDHSGFAIGIEDDKVRVCGGAEDRCDDVVLIQVVEQVEGVKLGAPSPWEDFKRDVEVFYPITGCYYSFARGFKIDPAISRAECEVAVLSAAVDADNLPRQVIEGGSKVVDSIAYYEGERLGRIAYEANANDGLTCLGVVLDGKSVRLRGNVCGEFGLKLSDVMLGPLDL